MPSSDTTSAQGLSTWWGQAMASRITVQVPRLPGRSPAAIGRAVDRAFGVFHDVEAACSRFDRSSALSRCNSRPARWHRVPPALLRSLQEAHKAYEETGGLFDARVHDVLVDLGYDRSFGRGIDAPGPGKARPPGTASAWRPRTRAALGLAHLGGSRVDLGGIAKGLALRWASEAMREATADFLIEAGGDIWAAGRPEPGSRWRIGVESPAGGGDPVAVLEVTDRGVATSSTRIRTWRSGGEEVHHLIDPRSGRPGGEGLRSVTVVHHDPAYAEVWSKTLFLAGPAGVGAAAAERDLPALWVRADGTVGYSTLLDPFLIWTAA